MQVFNPYSVKQGLTPALGPRHLDRGQRWLGYLASYRPRRSAWSQGERCRSHRVGPVRSELDSKQQRAQRGRSSRTDRDAASRRSVLNQDRGQREPERGTKRHLHAEDCLADLSLTKTVNTTRPNVGERITYTLALANAGHDSATNVVVSDRLPAGLKFNSALPSQGAYNVSNGLWRVGTLASGATATLQVIATVNSPGRKD